MARNPYAAPQAAKNGEAPDPSGKFRLGGPGVYAVPDIPETTDPEYTDGYSPELDPQGHSSGEKLPSDIRIDKRQPPINDPNNRKYWRTRWSNHLERHSVEETETGWDVQQRTIGPPAQNPMWNDPRLPIRPTADDSPLGYQFTRPWHIPRNAADAIGEDAELHFSLADHRRKYPIMGMHPRGSVGTNTYRADPRPWDEDLFIPPQAPDMPGGTVSGNRSYRL